MRSIVDGHCDTIVKLLKDGEGLLENQKHLDLRRLSEFGTPVQFFAIWLEPAFYPISLRQTIKSIDYYYSQLEQNKDIIRHSNGYQDILKNKAEGKMSGLLSLEGGEALEGDISSLRMLYRLGVRGMTLTWNHRNPLGDGVAERGTGGGLTSFGKDVVREMNRLGMVVDVSHLSENGFWDVERTAEMPYIASHSNAKGICSCPRNLTDEQIRVIAGRGGVIGINLYPPFIAEKETVDLEDVMRHIDYIINLAGDDCIGLGCDFDGIDKTPVDLQNISHLKKLLERIEMEYGKEIADKIAEKNFLRILKKILR